MLMTRGPDLSESLPSVQEEIFNTLLRTPHRSVDQILHIHREQMNRDPFLYGCLATYAVHNGECAVRDVQDVFVATLFVSEFAAHREAAWYMLQEMPPHRAKRIVQYVTGYAEIVHHSSADPPMPDNGKYGMTYDRRCYSDNHPDKSKRGHPVPRQVKKIGKKLRKQLKVSQSEITIDQWLVKHLCHNKGMNRVLRGAVCNYLHYREDNPAMMEGAILRARDSLRYLYAKSHVVPGKSREHWLNRCIFYNEPPAGSRIDALKKLINSNDPVEQANIIAEFNLPYPIVRSLIKKTPATTTHNHVKFLNCLFMACSSFHYLRQCKPKKSSH